MWPSREWQVVPSGYCVCRRHHTNLLHFVQNLLQCFFFPFSPSSFCLWAAWQSQMSSSLSRMTCVQILASMQMSIKGSLRRLRCTRPILTRWVWYIANIMCTCGSYFVRSPWKMWTFAQLGRRSMVFESAYVQNALCNPSRTSFLTSRRWLTSLSPSLPTNSIIWKLSLCSMIY